MTTNFARDGNCGMPYLPGSERSPETKGLDKEGEILYEREAVYC
ncbi:MAG: hypothetical protein ACOX4O_10375 [Eubacteriales bacterium]